MSIENPWLVAQAQSYHPGCQTVSATDRLHQIRNCSIGDIPWLQQVVAWPDNQKTVQAAAESKLRALQRLSKTAPIV